MIAASYQPGELPKKFFLKAWESVGVIYEFLFYVACKVNLYGAAV
jgi:hypothetical protein